MRKTLLAVLALLFILPAAFARSSRHSSTVSISTDDWEEITSCDQINVRFDGERATMREEVLHSGNLRALRGQASRNGGIRVTGWDRPDWSVKACRATSADFTSRMRPYLRGEEIGVEGDDDENLSVIFFLVRAPRNAVLDLEARNGELGIQGVGGSVTARTENGPITLKAVSGSVNATAQNGPITFAGNSGKVRLEAQNGPVTVKLTGSSWAAGSLDASTHNGPISLKIPRDYRSGVVVESDGHGPISCRAEACRQARRTWGNDDDDDDDSMRRIELGSGAQNVRMSTTNGPVSVKEER